MIISEINGILLGVGIGICLIVRNLWSHATLPKLEDAVVVVMAGYGLYSGIDVGIEMLSHNLTIEQLAVVEIGCLAIVVVALSEIEKRF